MISLSVFWQAGLFPTATAFSVAHNGDNPHPANPSLSLSLYIYIYTHIHTYAFIHI